MRLIFAGTPAFAVPALEALHAAGHRIAAVLTQPDQPAGRGRRPQPPPVARRGRMLGLAVLQPRRLDADAQAQLEGLAPEVIVVVAYGLMLPPTVLAIPPLGCLNIHASLLPRWRGAAPIARAIEAGDTATGITIMRMDQGLDTGPVLLAESVPIGATTTAGELHDVLAELGARLIVEALDGVADDRLAPRPQAQTGACYARKLSKDEARLDWRRPAAQLARGVRAFNPQPVAWSLLDGERVRIWRARALPQPAGAAPGTILGVDADGLRVATGDGVLLIDELQRQGGRALAASAAARGWSLSGRRFA
ncbi:MAG: methionyl-tRNA formyltransferase [Gammaproteobacteria bacterium]|nr:methionyl-tRNA formyltransferase [Gammaproteobacteria bacterium]